MSVALHLQRAFAVRDVTIASPFRPPLVPHVSNPYGVHRSDVVAGTPGGTFNASHRVVSLQATAAPFTPAAHRAPRPPPIDAGLTVTPAAPVAEVPAPVHHEVPSPIEGVPVTVESPNVELGLKPVANKLGVTAYTPESMMAVQWSCNDCSDRIKAFVKMMAPGWAGVDNADESRGGLFGGKSGKLRPERQLHHKVMSVLSRVTPEKYDALQVELLQLPIRQADDEQLTHIVDVFFNKAIHEEKFCGLYAGMVQSLFHAANEEAVAASDPQLSSPTTPNNAERTSALARKLRAALLNRCQQEFERPFQLTQADLSSGGVPLTPEEIAEKQHALKKRLCGNVRFVGELYLHSIVSERVIQNIVTKLLSNAQANQASESVGVTSSDDCMEALTTLLTVVGSKASDKVSEQVKTWIQVADEQSKNPKAKLSTRVRFLLMNLVDFANDGWGDLPAKLKVVDKAGDKKKKKPVKTTPTVASPTSGSSSGATSFVATPAAASKRSLPPKTGTSADSFGYGLDGLSSPSTPLDSPQKAAKAKTSKLSAASDETPRRRKFCPSANKALVELVTQFPEVDTLVHALIDVDLNTTDSIAASEIRDRAVANFYLTAARTRKLSAVRAAAPRVAAQLVTCPTIIESKSKKSEVARPFFDENQLSNLLNDIIVASIMDGVLDDAPHYYVNWLEMVSCQPGDGDCACNPGVVVHALIKGTAEACNEGIIDNEKQAITSLATAMSTLPTCRDVALEYLEEAAGADLSLSFVEGLRAAL